MRNFLQNILIINKVQKINSICILKRNSNELFLHWSNLNENLDLELCGAKAKNLAKLYNLDFPVPNGGVLGNNAYIDFLETNGLKEYAYKLDSKELSSIYNDFFKEELKEFQKLIISSEFPKSIYKDIIEQLEKFNIKIPFAVRSSASSEDSKQASFAGIHKSYLNITKIEELTLYIKKCFASLWTIEALTYRKHNNFNIMEVVQNVVIMEMINPESSGVAFTCDMKSRKKENFVINANFGLGESIVNGEVEPDEYHIDTKEINLKILKVNIGSKESSVKYSYNSGVIKEKNKLKTQVLDNNQIIQLSYLLKRISETISYFDKLYDFEWAFDGNVFWILQVRPVTTTDIFDSFETDLISYGNIWSNANFKDILPNTISPISWSIISFVIQTMLKAPFKNSKLKQISNKQYVNIINGRLYFNLSLIQWEYYNEFGITPQELNKGMGGHQPEIDISVNNKNKTTHNLNKLNLLFNLMKKRLFAKTFFYLKKKEIKSYLKKDFSLRTDVDLLLELRKVLKKLNSFAQSAQEFNILAGTSYSLLSTFLEKTKKSSEFNITNSLLRNKGNIESAEYAHKLLKLANILRKDESSKKAFIKIKDFSNLNKVLNKESTFYKEFLEFLNNNGHRAISELDVRNERWRDNPEYLLKAIQQILLTPLEELNNLKRDNKDLLSEYSFSKKITINILLHIALKDSSNREKAKSILVGYLEPIRMILIELGKSFKSKNILKNDNDIFFCTIDDLVQIIEEKWTGENLKSIIIERKNRELVYNDKEIKDVYCTDNLYINNSKPPIKESNKNELRGLAISDGVAKGNVKIINSSSQIEEFKTGDILVAKSIDIGWLPIFLRASGIVLEVGGYLSHGAIVARELGIPAVVNIPNVVSKLSNKSNITVNGNHGTVFINE